MKEHKICKQLWIACCIDATNKESIAKIHKQLINYQKIENEGGFLQWQAISVFLPLKIS